MIKSAAAWSEVRHDWSSSAIRSPFAGATGSRAPAGRSSRLGAPCLPLPQALPGLPDVLAVTLVARPIRAPPQGRSPWPAMGRDHQRRTRATVRAAVGPQRLAAGTEGFCGFAL